MYRITFLEECTIAKFPAEPLAIQHASRDRKHSFPRSHILYATSVNDVKGFKEITLNRPIHTYYRWYVPAEYVERIRIEEINASPISRPRATVA